MPWGSDARYGSDLVVDLLQREGVDVVAFNPGATFRGLHDSLVQRDDGPQVVLCLEESVAVAVAQGYAKASGRPMAVLVHDVVGLQRASMGLYNAWCDRVPLLAIGGTGPMSTGDRRPWIDWIHTALVQGQLVRDHVKWDDQPADLRSVPESLLRALRVAVADPPGPVYVCLDVAVQEQELDAPLPLPPGDVYGVPTAPAPDPSALGAVADALRGARFPVLVTDYAGATPEGFHLVRAVAELLCAPVVDAGARCNLATDHPLNATGTPGLFAEADLVLAVDVEDLYGALGPGVYLPADGGVRLREGVRVVHCTPQHYKLRGWTSDHQRLVPAEVVSSTATAALEGLRALLAAHPPTERVLAARGAWARGRRAAQRAAWAEEAAAVTAPTGIPAARIAAELWPGIRDRPWTVVNGSLDGWERRLWAFREPGQHLGWHGGGGLGYGLGASIGAALALAPDRLCIDLQPDGDLLYTPSALWTAAHLALPLLVVVADNRQYGNTVGHAAHMAAVRGRDHARRYRAAALDDPPVDHAALARSFGVWATGPVSTVEELRPALDEALAVIDSGRPALLHVLTPGA